jgi:hypothetical protein
VGISWLAPVFGLYFGYRLAQAGARPDSLGRAAGLPLAALGLIPSLALLASRMDLGAGATGHLAIWAVASAAATAVALVGWPALGRVLLAYAVLARLPVVAVMGAAIRWGWGTHYDALPPGFPPLPPLSRWLWTGVLPQMTIWIAWTVITGALFGVLAWWAVSRRGD